MIYKEILTLSKQHKWHKEIKAWADGAEIEHLKLNGQWQIEPNPEWQEYREFRIKPQPKEPKYLYAFWNGMIRRIDFATEYDNDNEMCKYIGKIKLEVDDE